MQYNCLWKKWNAKKEAKKQNKKGNAINVINSTAQQLYLVSRYEQTYLSTINYVCMYMRTTKRETQEGKKKGKKKQRTKRRMPLVGGRGSSQRSVRLNGCLYGTYLTTVHTTQCTLYGLIAQLADQRGTIVWKFRTRWNQWPWQVDNWHEWGWIWGFPSFVWPIVPDLLSDTSTYVPEQSIRTSSQPASEPANYVKWNDRIILMTLSNNANSPRPH